MKGFGIILLGVFVSGILVFPGGALAHPSHMSVHAQSPFDAPKVKKSLHCLLKGHHHKTLPFCPHTLRDRSTKTQLKSDCGDSSRGTLVQIQGSKILMLIPSMGATASADKKYSLTPKRFRLPSPFPDRREKPPQHA